MKTTREYELMILGLQKKIEIMDEDYRKNRQQLNDEMVILDQERRASEEASIEEQMSAIEQHSAEPAQKRKVSAAARKKMAIAQKKRWAAVRAAKKRGK